MGVQLIANDTVAPWYTKVIPPVTRGLEGWFTFDTDSSRFGFNRALDKGNAEIVGAPVAYPTHARFKGLSNFLLTDIAETDAMTILVLGKAVAAIPAGASISGDANTPYYVGNRNGAVVTPGYSGKSGGVSLYHVLPENLTVSGPRDNGAGGASLTASNLVGEVPVSWGIRGVRTQSGAPTRAMNLTRNLYQDGSSVAGRVLNGAKLRIGDGAGNFGAEVDISAVAIYSVALSDAEIAMVAGAMRKRAQRLGIGSA